jgi:hypothetical protein
MHGERDHFRNVSSITLIELTVVNLTHDVGDCVGGVRVPNAEELASPVVASPASEKA